MERAKKIRLVATLPVCYIVFMVLPGNGRRLTPLGGKLKPFKGRPYYRLPLKGGLVLLHTSPFLRWEKL